MLEIYKITKVTTTDYEDKSNSVPQCLFEKKVYKPEVTVGQKLFVLNKDQCLMWTSEVERVSETLNLIIVETKNSIYHFEKITN